MTAAADLRFEQTLAEVKAARGYVAPARIELPNYEQLRKEAARFDVSFCTGFFRHATGGQHLQVTRQEAKRILLSAGLERVMRTDQAKYVLVLREYDQAGKEVGYYECRLGSFPGIKLTDWNKVVDTLHGRR
jgi:hypothetical protein